MFETGKADPTETKKPYIERVRLAEFSEVPYRRFAALYRSKAQKRIIEIEVAGSRKRKNQQPNVTQTGNKTTAINSKKVLFEEKDHESKGKRAPSNFAAASKDKKQEVDSSDDESYENDSKEESEDNKRAGGADTDDEEDEEEDDDENPTDDEIDNLVEAFNVTTIGNRTKNITMKPIQYEWLHSSGVKMLTMDFLVPSLGQDSIKAKISKSGMYLEITIIMPDMFYNKGRLVEASITAKASEKMRLSSAKMTAFAAAVETILNDQDNDDGVVIYRERHKLPFNVELDAVSANLALFRHEDAELDDLEQYLFLFSVEMESVIKPRKPKVSGRKALNVFASPQKPSAENRDPYKTSETHDDAKVDAADAMRDNARTGEGMKSE